MAEPAFLCFAVLTRTEETEMDGLSWSHDRSHSLKPLVHPWQWGGERVAD